MKEKAPYDSDMRPVVIDLSIFHTIEKQVPQKDVSNAYALYCFYYKHSILQSTQTVWCHNRMVVGLNSDGSKNGKGFGWCPEKVARIRKLLQDCDLIRVIRRRQSDGTYSKKTYVWVRWYKGRDAVEKAKYQAMIAERDEQISEMSNRIKQMQRQMSQSVKNRDWEKRTAQSGKNRDQDKKRVNACSTKEVLNACSPKGTVAHTKRMGRRPSKSLNLHAGRAKARKGFSYQCALKLYQGLASKRKIMRKPNLIAWAKEFKAMKATIPTAEIIKVRDWYIANIGKGYVPQAYSAKSFRDKFPNIAYQMEQQTTEKKKRERLDDGTWTDGEDDHWESFPCTPEEAEQLRQEEAEYNRRMGIG